jgi:2-polyprenyl-3-methyl-5-hydroxy-6-metoxy-1,4-benzoquinol methylase
MQRLDNKNESIKGFVAKIMSLNVDVLPISDYNKIYLKKHLETAEYAARLAWQILEQGVKYCPLPIESLTVAEIGGGTGIISLLAKYLGFKSVIYSDTYAQSCLDFEVIAKHLALKPNSIVQGDIHQLIAAHPSEIHLMVSRDVIEHIYKPEAFFQTACHQYPNCVMVHNTSANIYNLFKANYFKTIHLKDELEGNTNQFKPGDSTASFYQMRLDFIKTHYPALDEFKQILFAKLTRGHTFDDVKTAIDLYLDKKQLPHLISHPTNTCDPATGNWTEHLIKFDDYRSMIPVETHHLKIEYAPYNQFTNRGPKQWVQFLLNLIIKTGFFARYVAPAILIIAKPHSAHS